MTLRSIDIVQNGAGKWYAHATYAGRVVLREQRGPFASAWEACGVAAMWPAKITVDTRNTND